MPTTLLMSFGERAAYAGRMLLIGMGAIFLSLALLWGVVELFRRLVTREPEPAVKEATAPAPAVSAPLSPAAPASNDALIAAITAAIAATLAEENGGTAPAFRVVSFQKVNTVSKRK
jgi:sodium pump decarboxylase gamma subunit